MTRNSRTLSNVAVSLPPSRITGRSFCEVVAEQLAPQQTLTGAHPVDVAAQRVDLAVVRDVAVWVRERPRRKGVRAEPLVHERQRRFEVRIRQVWKHRLELPCRQHALVDERACRQADDVEERRDSAPIPRRSAACSRRFRITYSFRSNAIVR